MTQEQKRQRAKELWEKLRKTTKAVIFLKRILRKDKESLFINQFERVKKEGEEEQAKTGEIAPWLIDPKISYVYKFWLLILALVLQFELFFTPIALVWPVYKAKINSLFWVCDVFWILSIGL